MKISRILFLTGFASVIFSGCNKIENSEEGRLSITIDPANEQQVIRNFGASDAWSCQFVGKNWPSDKRNEIADLLFSMETDENNNPEGIGLSLWRFNIGAGTAEQGESSDINDEWRRAESFLNADGSYDWQKQEGQQWFLEAAKQRGVNQFVAFVNSPPVYYTLNGKGYSAHDSHANLQEDKYDDFANFMTDVLQHFQQNGTDFSYISPVNEPQWDWDNPGQEGSSYQNSEIYELVKKLDQSITEKGLEAKIEIPEAGKITALYGDDSLPERDNQIAAFFDPDSPLYLGELPNVAPKVAGHSYFTTYPDSDLRQHRQQLKQQLAAVDPGLEYWMSEYCILEDNAVIKGNGRDLGMDPAIYLAKVIHYDLVYANASAWHWWVAISPYDYKDGLVYIDYDKSNGEVLDSKMLWAMGNFSRFVRPGMRRLGVETEEDSTSVDSKVLVSAFHSEDEFVVVMINTSYEAQPVDVTIKDSDVAGFRKYITSSAAGKDLAYDGKVNYGQQLELPSRSIVTLVSDK